MQWILSCIQPQVSPYCLNLGMLEHSPTYATQGFNVQAGPMRLGMHDRWRDKVILPVVQGYVDPNRHFSERNNGTFVNGEGLGTENRIQETFPP